MPIGQSVAEIWRFSIFFQNGGHSPSWICNTRVGPPMKSIFWRLSLSKFGLIDVQ